MKNVITLLALTLVVPVLAANVETVSVRQLWPWSKAIRVDYSLSQVTAPVDLAIEVYDGEEKLALDLPSPAVVGDVYFIDHDGAGFFTIDPTKAFGTPRPAFADFKVKLTVVASAPLTGEVLYKIVDIDSGTVTNIRRADFYDGRWGSYETNFAAIASGFTTTATDVLVWTDVTNHSEYVTSKIVMRKIKAKDVVWRMGETDSGPNTWQNDPHWVKLTNDYYIGVFPVTQAQYSRVRTGEVGKYFTDGAAYPDHLTYPVAGLPYGEMRGYTSWDSWPTGGHAIASWTFAKILRNRSGVLFDLPTEAQWEFACRGGVYAKALYSGKSYSQESTLEVAWCALNAGGQMHPVTALPPNAYGLYDMLGNAYEWTLDFSANYSGGTEMSDPVIEPQGPNPNGTYHIARAGTYSIGRTQISAAVRTGLSNTTTSYATGFRLWCPAD